MSRDRERICAHLARAGFKMDPSDIFPQTHTHRHWDLMAWSGVARDKNGFQVTVGSWDTMRDCARAGAEVADNRGEGGHHEVNIEVHAAPKRPRKGPMA